MPVPIVYRKAPASITSFDFFDAATATGYLTFYLCGAADTGGDVEFITGSTIDGASQNALHGAGERTYDIEFKKQVYVRGEVFTNATLQVGVGATSGHINIDIYHYDGTTETAIANMIGGIHVSTGTFYFRDCQKATITGQNFGVGDILRIKVGGYGDSGGAIVKWYADPGGRVTPADSGPDTAGTLNSTFQVHIPIRVTI